MSVSIYVVAQKEITETEFKKVGLYNGLVENGYEPPEQLKSELTSLLGSDIFDDEFISIPENKQVVELEVESEGNVMYGDGMAIPISSLPTNTIAIRVYSMT